MIDRVGYGVGVAIRAAMAPVALGMRWAKHGLSDDEPGIPAPNWNIGLVSKVVLDDFFFASELISATVVSLSNRKRVSREIADSVEFYESQGWLDEPAEYHLEPTSIGEIEETERTSSAGIFRHISFESGYQPYPGEPGRERWLGYEANKIAHAWVLEHRGEQRPWVVCIPGYRMGTPLIDFTGFKARWLHRDLGLNVAIPVMPLHGPRSVGKRGGDGFLTGDFVDTVHAQAQAIWDTRKLIAWLRDAGAPSIAAYGVSLGGYTTALLAAIEGDLDCVIAGVPATDFVRLLRSHLPPIALDFAERLKFPFDEIEQLLRPVSPLAMPPRVAKERRFLYAGVVDSLAVPSQARDLWRHWQRPRLEWYEGGHVSFLWESSVKLLVEEALVATGLVEEAGGSVGVSPNRYASASPA